MRENIASVKKMKTKMTIPPRETGFESIDRMSLKELKACCKTQKIPFSGARTKDGFRQRIRDHYQHGARRTKCQQNSDARTFKIPRRSTARHDINELNSIMIESFKANPSLLEEPSADEKCLRRFMDANNISYARLSNRSDYIDAIRHWLQCPRPTFKLQQQHSAPMEAPDVGMLSVQRQKVQQQFKGLIMTYTFAASGVCTSRVFKIDLACIFADDAELSQTHSSHLQKHGPYTSLIAIKVGFQNLKTEEVFEIWFDKKSAPFRNDADVTEFMRSAEARFAEQIESYEGRGSGLRYEDVKEIKATFSKWNPSTTPAFGSYVELPGKLKNKTAYVNVKNMNNENCFKYALCSALFPAPHSVNRAKQYEEHFQDINWTPLTFPIKLSDKDVTENLAKFEDENLGLPPLNIHTLWDWNDEHPFPFYISSKPQEIENVVNLMFFDSKDGEKSHVVWMKNVARALCSLTKHKTSSFVCVKCYNPFFSREAWQTHNDRCTRETDPTILQMPGKPCKEHKDEFQPDTCEECRESIVCKFKRFETMQTIPVVIYADTEARNVRTQWCVECVVDLTTTAAADQQLPSGHDSTHSVRTMECASCGAYLAAAADDSQEDGKPFCSKCNGRTRIITRQELQSYLLYFSVAEKYQSVFPEFVRKIVKCTHKDPDEVREHLFKTLVDETTKINDIITNTNVPCTNFPPTLSNDCSICEKPISAYEWAGMDHTPHRDHDHLTGEYRGPAHPKCNRRYTLKDKPIPVVFHGFKGYDAKMIIGGVSTLEQDTDDTRTIVTGIVENSEKFKMISVKEKQRSTHIVRGEEQQVWKTVCNFQFIDSLAHLGSSSSSESHDASLGALVQNLKRGHTTVEDLRAVFSELSAKFSNDEQFVLLLRKGVFPYDWVDSFDKLEHRGILEQKDFFNCLSGETISDADYAHYNTVWHTFGMQTFREYHDLYLLCDVLLLADVGNAYRSVCRKIYKLDPWWYVTAPSLAWQAALKFTGQELQLITDVDMYSFFRSGIRGGMSFIANRAAKANNMFMADFDPDAQSSFIEHLDANNLYGWSMSRFLPTGGFRWVPEAELASVMGGYCGGLSLDYHKGYVLEVDLEYNDRLHDFHNDFPLLAEHCTPPGSTSTKLISHLANRTNYIIDGTMLKFCLREGIVCTKIHRCMEYDQSDWLAPYIVLNSNERKKAKSEFERDFFKLMNNSVYGQTLMDVTKFVNFELIHTPKRLEWKQRKPQFIKRQHAYRSCTNCQLRDTEIHAATPCSCLTGLEMRRKTVTLNRPIYLGFKILELSKLIMYEFWYKLKKRFDTKIRLLATDTDSFIFEVFCEDVYNELYAAFRDYFDFSNYDREHPLYNTTNEKVPGKMKDEKPRTIIVEWVGLLSKCYSLKCVDERESASRAKGVTKAAKKRCLPHEDYRRTLETGCAKVVQEARITSKCMKIRVIEQKKVALANDDDKRVWIGRDTEEPWSAGWGNTLAHGHYRIRSSEAATLAPTSVPLCSMDVC
jgi:hypothetical protein